MAALEWRGWSRSDRNSHAVVNGQTVCGVMLECNTLLVYDWVTACPECRQILAKENEGVFLGKTQSPCSDFWVSGPTVEGWWLSFDGEDPWIHFVTTLAYRKELCVFWHGFWRTVSELEGHTWQRIILPNTATMAGDEIALPSVHGSAARISD